MCVIHILNFTTRWTWIHPCQYLSYLNPRSLRKILVEFSNDTFSIEAGIMNLFYCILGIWFIQKNTLMVVLKYNGAIKKVTWLWLLFWYFPKKPCSTRLKHRVWLVQDLWMGYLMSKKPRLIKANDLTEIKIIQEP